MNTSTLRQLAVEPLTREAFAPFGDVIEVSDSVRHFTINDGNTERYHDLANIDPGPDGKAIVSIFRGLARSLPFTVSMMERHPRGSCRAALIWSWSRPPAILRARTPCASFSARATRA
jgi:ureidoglycolate lyase